MKNVIRNIIFIIAGVCAGLLIIESAGRIYVRRAKVHDKLDYLNSQLNNTEQRKIGRKDEILGWGLKPSSSARVVTSDYDVAYEINSSGFRDREVAAEKAAHEFRIVLLGESMVMGQGVNYGQRFSEVVEAALRNVTAVNMGIWGYGMDQSLVQLESSAAQFHPDLVAVVIGCTDYKERCRLLSMAGFAKPVFILNKARDNIVFKDIASLKQEFGVFSAMGQPAAPTQPIGQQAMAPRSSLGLLVGYWRTQANFRQELKQREQAEWARLGAVHTQDQKYPYERQEDFEQVIYLLLQRYGHFTKANGCKLLIVNIADTRDDIIERKCSQLGIPYYDLSGVLVKASGRQALRFTVDPHYNAFTHRVIGEYLADYLCKTFNREKNSSYNDTWLGQF